MRTMFFSAMLASLPLPLLAQQAPYVLGPDGSLHLGIEPGEYFNGLEQWPRDGTQEWCFWPLGCWSSQDPELTPERPGPAFDPESYSLDQYDRLRNQNTLSIELLPIDPRTLQYFE